MRHSHTDIVRINLFSCVCFNEDMKVQKHRMTFPQGNKNGATVSLGDIDYKAVPEVLENIFKRQTGRKVDVNLWRDFNVNGALRQTLHNIRGQEGKIGFLRLNGHGLSGKQFIGESDESLSIKTADDFVKMVGPHLLDGAHIHLDGCRVGFGPEGKALIEAIGQGIKHQFNIDISVSGWIDTHIGGFAEFKHNQQGPLLVYSTTNAEYRFDNADVSKKRGTRGRRVTNRRSKRLFQLLEEKAPAQLNTIHKQSGALRMRALWALNNYLIEAKTFGANDDATLFLELLKTFDQDDDVHFSSRDALRMILGVDDFQDSTLSKLKQRNEKIRKKRGRHAVLEYGNLVAILGQVDSAK